MFEELKARQQPDEAAVPWKDGAYEYQWRFAQDAQYRIWTRWPVGHPDRVQTFLDEPALAAGLDYFSLGGLDISPNGRYLAYTTDTDGSERYTLHVKDLTNGERVERYVDGLERRHRLGKRQRDAVLRGADRQLATLSRQIASSRSTHGI